MRTLRSCRKLLSALGAGAAVCILAITVVSSTAGAAGGAPVVNGVRTAPFVDQTSLAGQTVTVNGMQISPDSLSCGSSTNYTSTTTKCITPTSSAVYISGARDSGLSFKGHLELTRTGVLVANEPPNGTTFGSYGVTLTGSFPAGYYCNTLWRNNGAGGYSFMGNVCELT